MSYSIGILHRLIVNHSVRIDVLIAERLIREIHAKRCGADPKDLLIATLNYRPTRSISRKRGSVKSGDEISNADIVQT